MELGEREIINYASQLQGFLIAHDLATSQLQFLDEHVSQLTQRLFSSNLEGNHGQSVHLLTRKSVADGVQKVFQQLKQVKHKKIQELSAIIMQQLLPEEDITTDLSLDGIISQLNDSDGLVPVMTESFCVASRSM